MTAILIAYGTTTGQTAKVARCMDEVLTDRGFDVTVHHLQNGDVVDPADYDAVLVGASVTNRAHQPAVVAFVERHASTLAERPSGFFQLSLASAIPWQSAQRGAQDYVDSLTAATGWEPDRIGLFAGTLPYSEFSRPLRWVFQLAAIPTGLGRDTSRDYEYTDWEEVEDFAVTFGEFAEIERARVAEAPAGGAGGGSRLRRAAVALGALGLAGAALWVLSQRRARGELEALTGGGEPGAEPGAKRGAGRADESRPAPAVEVEEPGSVPGETVDVEQA